MKIRIHFATVFLAICGLVVGATIGCSNLQEVGADGFQQLAARQPESMFNSMLIGCTADRAYLEVWTMSSLPDSVGRRRVVWVALSQLPSETVRELRDG